jgi:MYXO-CTERM domain-containing protein
VTRRPPTSALPSIGAALALLAGAAPASAAVQFFVNDPGGFEAAIADRTLMGVEDWSAAGNAAARPFASPLSPGVANEPFPQGTSVAAGMTVVPNANGANGAALLPGEVLFFAPTGFAGASGNLQPSNQVSAFFNDEAFHMAFADVAGRVPLAISFSPTFYRTDGAANSGTITVTVYGAANALTGSTTVQNVVDSLETSFLGILGAPAEIRRVNLWAGGTAVAGADNIRVFAPEPAAGAAAALAALGGLAWRRRRVS